MLRSRSTERRRASVVVAVAVAVEGEGEAEGKRGWWVTRPSRFPPLARSESVGASWQGDQEEPRPEIATEAGPPARTRVPRAFPLWP